MWWWIAVPAFLYLALWSFYAIKTMPQFDFGQLPLVPAAAPGQKVLVLVPHPDDESLALGGYLFMCRQNRASVRLVLISDGNRRGMGGRRYEEFKAAARYLGISESELFFWGYPDGALSLYQDQISARLHQEISGYKPDLLMYPAICDWHQDHSVIGRLVEQVLTLYSSNDIKAYAFLIHYRFYPRPRLLSWHPHLAPPRRLAAQNEPWEKIILSPGARQAKYSALNQYRSQLQNPLLIPLFLVFNRENELLSPRLKKPHS